MLLKRQPANDRIEPDVYRVDSEILVGAPGHRASHELDDLMTGCKNSSVFETVLDVVGTMGIGWKPSTSFPATGPPSAISQ